MRTDARRNREIVLRTAIDAFSEEGVAVSLGRIAQRAGVGAGTVYRHFPSKDALLEAVLADHVEELVAAADRWAARADPGDALIGFLAQMSEKSAGRAHVCETLSTDRSWPRAVLGAAMRRYQEALQRLLRAAQSCGAVRADIDMDDLTAISIGCANLRAAHPDSVRGRELVLGVLAGLRVTKTDGFRDLPVLDGHETARCAECGDRLRVRPTGRPARYCGATCRQRARRRRAIAG